jgi:Uma2 family endonuclease
VHGALGRPQLYAECGVPEYWVVNLVDRVVEVHRQPHAGRYEAVTVHQQGERLGLLAFPDVELIIDDFLR